MAWVFLTRRHSTQRYSSGGCYPSSSGRPPLALLPPFSFAVVLESMSDSPSAFLTLLFPERRQPLLKALGSCRLLFRTMARLGAKINWNAVNLLSVQELPLSAMCVFRGLHTDATSRPPWYQVLVKDA